MFGPLLVRLRAPRRSPAPAVATPVALSGAPLRRAVCAAVEADVAERLDRLSRERVVVARRETA